ncbi:hypothetical protein [Actinomadura monticuli]|uniref:Uncharacterized protein n=1 Tax=Actinomadura monticuli TaxID=3097367 RepID=A0ABV4QB37_9ACTN
MTGSDLVQAMWLPEGRVSLAATRLRRDGVKQGMSKDALRGFVEEDYETTASCNQRRGPLGEADRLPASW